VKNHARLTCGHSAADFLHVGEGVVKLWTGLPQQIQHELFEAAVLGEGEDVRSQLAIFLHHTHNRTTDALKAHAMAEPDSKGG
jgi:hypothetical protein